VIRRKDIWEWEWGYFIGWTKSESLRWHLTIKDNDVVDYSNC
jgi:hypothetical protein